MDLKLETSRIDEDILGLYDLYRSFHLFSSDAADRSHTNDLVGLAKAAGFFHANTCESFENWFEKLCKAESLSQDNFEDFKTLVMSSGDFKRLCTVLSCCLRSCSFLYCHDFEYVDDMICVRSSDNVVLEMKKSAAITQSGVLGDLLDLIPAAGHDGDEIPLPQLCSSVLPKVISFCKKKYKFTTLIEGTVKHLKDTMEHLKGTVDAYKAWVTSFVKTNRPLFSYLHQAADFLQIPTLFELTSKAVGVGDLNENSVEEISEWYAGLSIPRMLSPMGTETYSMLSQLDFFSKNLQFPP